MNRFQRSWLLVKSSLSVIGRNKLLLIFPIVVFVCTIAIVLFFVAPAVLRPTSHPYFSAEHWQAIGNSLFQESAKAGGNGGEIVFTPGAAAYLAFLYFLTMFVATFFNVAFYHEILVALRGEAVSISRGLKFAFTKLASILMWTLFAGVVGLIIKAIEERLALLGKIIARFIGLAWSVAAVFAIPVIVCGERNQNPFGVLKKSAGMLKQTWGEALIGYVGLAFVNTLVFLGSFLFLIAAIVVSAMLHNYWIIAVVGVFWLVALFTWGYVSSVASHVYRGALYLYAAEGMVAEPYNQELLDMAWKHKKQKMLA